MSPRRFASSLVLLGLTVAGLTGCLPEPKRVDHSQLINGGVNIVPGPVLAAEKQRPSTAPARRAGPDLVEAIQRSDQKNYHVIELLRESGLVPTLQTAGPYTVFAPTDAAFDKMPPGTLAELLKPANHERLVRFARYHILRGRVDFGNLSDTNGQVQTLAGPPTSPAIGANSPARPMGTAVIIRGLAGKVMVNDANVVRTDTGADNGVVHWIDNVLIPPARLDSNSLDGSTPDAEGQ